MSTPSSTPVAKRPRTRKSSAERSREIHDVAVDIAREEGLSALTIRAVAARAGVAPGLVPHYVGSMDELVAHTFTAVTAAELDLVRRAVSAAEDPLDQLAGVIETVLGRDHDDITLVWVDAWSLGRGSALLAAAIDEQMAAWEEGVAEILRAGQEAGAFRVADPDIAAGHIVALIDGISAHALARSSDTSDFASRLAQACETLVGTSAGAITSRLSDADG